MLTLSEEEDEWKWGLEEDGSFSVKSSYLFLDKLFMPESSLSEEDLRVFSLIWKSPAPSKVLAFSWKLLRDRLPTRNNLALRGVHVNGGFWTVFTVTAGKRMLPTCFCFVILWILFGRKSSAGLVW
jgi:hypothetical protein